MASTRLARRRQEAAPAQNNPPSPVLSAEQAAKLDRLAEDFLHDLGLSPQSVNGLTEKQFGLKLGLMFSGSELGRLTFDLDEQDVEWLKAQPGRAMQTDSVSGEPKLYLFPQQQEDTERILAEWESRLGTKDAAQLGQIALNKLRRWWGESVISSTSTPTHGIEHPPQIDERRRMLDYDKSFIQDGVRYFPLSLAAPIVQAPAPSLLHWIKKQTKFDGRPLQSYYFAPVNQYFISEESIDRAANRFIKWPSQEPAGPVTLGEKRDQNGYIGLTDAARTIGVDHHTMWRWTTKGTAPTDKPLDVVKCPASDQLYIRQKDVTALKKLVPRSGLRAGRRPQTGLQHG
jgi:hypothetical protein